MSRILRLWVHFTWVFVFALVTAIVTTQFSADFPLVQRVIFGLSVSLLFLVMTAVRELVLSVAVYHKGNPSRKMTLFAFGGLYHDIPEQIAPPQLLFQYLARYLSNLVIAALFYGLYATFVNAGNEVLAGISQWLAYLFALMFLLHFIPAFPLDGGDILRMIMWHISDDYYKATQRASLIGLSIGLFLVFCGVLVLIVNHLWMISLVMIIFGWIVAIAAGSVRRVISDHMALLDVRAMDLMTREFPYASKQTTIAQVTRESILGKGWNYVVATENGRLEGILTLKQIRSLALKNWSSTKIADLMTPPEGIFTVRPDETGDRLYAQMRLKNIDYIPVIENDAVSGVVTRQALMNLVKIRAALGIRD